MGAMGLGRSAPAIELSGVHKAYGANEALKGIDMRIEPGELVAVLGPNGAGKTTAIALMLGLRRPTSGEVRLFGLPPSDERARSLRGAMLQDSGVQGLLTVRELVDLVRSYYRYPIPAELAIGLANLNAEAGRPAAKLSGGQRQRLYFALAICGDPQVLFLDEPTVAMDVLSRRTFLDAIRGFAANGKTVVLTTHDMDEADLVAQRVIVIDKGRMVADDSPAAIKARVAGKRVSFRVDANIDLQTFAGLPVHGLSLPPASPDPHETQPAGGLVRFLSSEPEATLQVLFARGLPLRDLEVTGADLEEAFLSLTNQQEALS
jgi:ABC-2 type transport system ATP-binding protein